MKARNWLFLASFLLMLKGAMDISIYFVQYLSLGLRYIPTAPAQMHRANVLCIIYGSYGVCLLIVGSRAASSHTGAIASSDSAVEALFRKAGIVRCYSREELTTVGCIRPDP